MPDVTFKGFAGGAPVALSVLQGGTALPASVAAWGDGALETFEGTFTITAVTAGTLPAPTAVWFEASDPQGFDVAEVPGPGDPSFDGISYVWTVERAGGDPAPERTAYGVPWLVGGREAGSGAWVNAAAWDNTRIAYGKKVALFFDEPGTTYTVNCWAIDQSGNRGRGTRASGETGLTITTDDADDLYAGAATICLDPSGAFTGAPAGAQQVTGVSAMQSAIGLADGPRRVLIARGQDIADFRIDENGGGHVRYVGAFGPAAERPVLRSDGFSVMFDFYQTSAPQLTIAGLECRGLWDAATETGRPADLFRPFLSSLQNFTMWDCRVDGFSAINASLNSSAHVMAIGKTEITNWQDYGVFIADTAHSRLAFVGCDIAQAADALNDSQTERNGMVNQQGPLRAAGYDSLYIAASSFMSRAGWAGGNDQPCLRLNSTGRYGATTIVERTTCEAGGAVVFMTGSEAAGAEQPGNYLFDKVLILAGGGKTGYEMVLANYGGTTFRNAIFVMPDVPNPSNIAFSNCLDLTPDQNDAGNLATPVKVYNCTSLNLRSAANDSGDNPRIAGPSQFVTYSYENNVVHAPTLDTPVSADAVVTSIGTASFEPRYRGIRPNFEFERGSLAAPVADGSSFTLPYPAGTTQAYWQAIQATDTRHMMKMGDANYYAAFDGRFEVAYDASSVRITNRSGAPWPGGTPWTLRLDRASQLPAMDPTYGNPATLALPFPVPGSPIAGNGDQGYRAYDDFLATPRPGPGSRDHRGDTLPPSGNASGALLAAGS